MSDPRRYWLEYSELQLIKHDLIRKYLQAWFAKLALGGWHGRLVYFDTHAGRGRYAEGELGSPLVALDALLGHSSRDRLLENSEITFVFIERDAESVAALEEEIAARHPLPRGVHVYPIEDDSFEFLKRFLDEMDEAGATPAPTFLFLDPYGFKMPGGLLARLMGHPRVELFINLMWRHINMAIRGEIKRDTPSAMSTTLDELFGGGEWRERLGPITGARERGEEAVLMLEELTGARWTTHIRMRGPNGATKYYLIHFTNHNAGRELMKDCLWSVCPDGRFEAWQSTDRSQPLLIEPQPDLLPLESWLRSLLRQRPRKWKDLQQELLPTLYRKPHLTALLRSMRKDGKIDYQGDKFAATVNPLIFLTEE